MSEEESEVEQLKRRVTSLEAELRDVKKRCVLREPEETVVPSFSPAVEVEEGEEEAEAESQRSEEEAAPSHSEE